MSFDVASCPQAEELRIILLNGPGTLRAEWNIPEDNLEVAVTKLLARLEFACKDNPELGFAGIWVTAKAFGLPFFSMDIINLRDCLEAIQATDQELDRRQLNFTPEIYCYLFAPESIMDVNLLLIFRK